MPTPEEIEAIELITEHVADAIMCSRDPKSLARPGSGRSAKSPLLRLVSDNQTSRDPANRLLVLAGKLQSKAVDLDSLADRSESETAAQNLRDAAELSRKLATNMISQIEFIRSGKRVP
jgi:hypothetical protein